MKRREFSREQKGAMLRRASDAKGNIWCEGCGLIRLRKAWHITVRSLSDMVVEYAPTRSQARAQAIDRLRDAWGLRWPQALAEIVSVRRAPGRDVALPTRHPLAPTLHPEILHCVVHAYGGTGLRAGYRDHFYTCATDWQMKAALYHALFCVHRVDKGRGGRPDQIMYELTAIGRNVARGEAETYPRW